MKNDIMEYKNYLGSVHYSDKDKVLYGKVEGIRALVSYEGNDVKSIKKAFQEAVDDYIETCNKEGRDPEVTFKGSFNIRIRPEIHRIIAMKAASQGVSLNRYIAEILDRETAENKGESFLIQKQQSSKKFVGCGTFRVSKTKAAGKAASKKLNFPMHREMIKKKTSKSIMVEKH